MGWDYYRYTKIVLATVACFGIILVCISIWTLGEPIMKYLHAIQIHDYMYDKPLFKGRMFITVPAIGICLGILVATVMCVGIFLSLENAWIRRLVTWGSVVLLALNIAGIICLCMDDDLMNRNKLYAILSDKVKDYHYSQQSMDLMDAIQWKLQCCGSNGVRDYFVTPESYQLGIADTCPEAPVPQRGCIDPLLIYISRRWDIFISIYIILTLLQVAAITSVCLLGYKGFHKAPTVEE